METTAKVQKTQVRIDSLLHNIKPAATKLILDGSKIDVLDVIKLTFFDLLVKQVLRVKKEYRKAHERDTRLREYVIVETGEKFFEYKFDRFESYFIDIIDENSFYYLKSFVRKVYKDLPSNYKCYQYILEGSRMNHNFNLNLVTQIFRLTVLSSKGKTFRKKIEEYLNGIDSEILNLLDDNPNEALRVIDTLKGNIFLLKNVKFDLFEKLKPRFGTTPKDNDYEFFNMDYYFEELFDTITDTFDTIDDFVNDNASFDSDADIDF